MNELTNANQKGGLSIAENLAREAQFYSMQTQFNMLQLGRVLKEAKEVVEHGQWLDWIDKNAGCSERQAQICMQLYETYGLNSELAALGASKLKILLPMTEEERGKLLNEKDVKNMSVRALKDEVKAREAEIRAEEQEKAREAVAAEKVNAAKMAESAARKAEKETRAKLEEEMEALRAERADMALKAKELQARAELAEGQIEAANLAAREATRGVSEQSAALDAERRRIERELKDTGRRGTEHGGHSQRQRGSRFRAGFPGPEQPPAIHAHGLRRHGRCGARAHESGSAGIAGFRGKGAFRHGNDYRKRGRG